MSEDSQKQRGVPKLKKEQYRVLLFEGFEPAGGDLWRREGIYYGREAALQYAHSSIRQRAAYAVYDKPKDTPQGKAF